MPLRDTGILTGNVWRVPQDLSPDGRYLLYAEGSDLLLAPDGQLMAVPIQIAFDDTMPVALDP